MNGVVANEYFKLNRVRKKEKTPRFLTYIFVVAKGLEKLPFAKRVNPEVSDVEWRMRR